MRPQNKRMGGKSGKAQPRQAGTVLVVDKSCDNVTSQWHLGVDKVKTSLAHKTRAIL